MPIRKQHPRPRNPSIYSRYAAPPSQTQTRAKKSGPSRNGPMILIVGFTLFIAFVLASITYANLSQRSGGGIFGIAASKSTLQKLDVNECADNKNRQELVVSIAKRHLWACSYSVTVQNSPVVTGMEMYAADKTPTGTYHIEQKQQDIQLTGADSTGSWNVHVDYWMQFLQNQYGRYGFHDALWRKPSEFGHTSPNSHTASHGCVESPLATMKWIYDWAAVGTTVVIEG